MIELTEDQRIKAESFFSIWSIESIVNRLELFESGIRNVDLSKKLPYRYEQDKKQIAILYYVLEQRNYFS